MMNTNFNMPHVSLCRYTLLTVVLTKCLYTCLGLNILEGKDLMMVGREYEYTQESK